jgi:hypothetical protein
VAQVVVVQLLPAEGAGVAQLWTGAGPAATVLQITCSVIGVQVAAGGLQRPWGLQALTLKVLLNTCAVFPNS